MYHGEREGSYHSYEACTFCRYPGGEAESVSSEQGFNQIIAQASRNGYRPNIVDEEIPPGACRIVGQCWQQRAFARWGWGWAQDRLNPFVDLVLYARQYIPLCSYWVVHRAFIDLVLGSDVFGGLTLVRLIFGLDSYSVRLSQNESLVENRHCVTNSDNTRVCLKSK